MSTPIVILTLLFATGPVHAGPAPAPCHARAGGQDEAARTAASRATLLFIHDRPQTGGERQVLDAVRCHLSSDVTIESLEAATLAAAAGPRAGEDQRLQAYALMRARGASAYALLTFQRNDAIVRLELFDGIEGVRARRGAKLRSMGAEEITAEHRGWLEEMLAAFSSQLEEARRIARASSNQQYPGEVVWRRSEVPPAVGFRWKFTDDGPVVTYVYEGASVAAAGLAAGDRLIGVNSKPVPTPPLLGRAVGPLRPGDPLRLRVDRNDKTLEIEGRVESAAKLVPSWQARVLNRAAGEILAADAPPRLGHLLAEGRPLLLLVFSPRMPDTWDMLPELRWLAEHYRPDQVSIVALARAASEEQARAFADKVRPGWPVIADPTSALAGALRVWDLPDLILVDAEGILRYRQVDAVHLRQALETLLARAR